MAKTSSKVTTKKVSRKTTKKESTENLARPISIPVEEPVRSIPIPAFEYGDWGGDEGDRAQYAVALAEHVRKYERERLTEPSRDTSEMPFVVLEYPKFANEDEPEIVKCFISATKSYMKLSDNEMQLSKQSPVGDYISNNKSAVKEGCILPPPSNARVLRVGFVRQKNSLATAH